MVEDPSRNKVLVLARRARNDTKGGRRLKPDPISSYAVFSQTEMWLLLALVKGSRFQSLQRSRKVMPASRAIRSSSDGHT